MSLGEFRVRTQFNPSADSTVDQIKQKTAELINVTNSIVTEAQVHNQNDIDKLGEQRRLAALAMTHYETAAMFAVKAATI